MPGGGFWFGIVIGFITYRTLRHKTSSGISDLAAVIGAVGGGIILQLFPAGSSSFDAYAAGLFIGFFAYLAISLVIAGATGSRKASNELLGD